MDLYKFNGILDRLILCRFENLDKLKERLNKEFPNYIVEIGNKEELPEDDWGSFVDYCFVGTITNNENYFDFDLWYLKDRQGNIVVTETAGEEQ